MFQQLRKSTFEKIAPEGLHINWEVTERLAK